MQRGPRSEALRGVPNPSAPAKALTERSELFCFSEGFEPPRGPGRGKHSKKPPCLLDKAALGCYIGVSKNGCQCKWRSSLVDFSSVEIAAYRSGGRLFLMPEGRYDQRRKTDEHQRICKHICICDHIAHPLFDRGRFCGNAIAAPQSGPRAICPAPRERRNAAGSRFVRRPRRFDQPGPPAQTAPGKGTMFLP